MHKLRTSDYNFEKKNLQQAVTRALDLLIRYLLIFNTAQVESMEILNSLSLRRLPNTHSSDIQTLGRELLLPRLLPTHDNKQKVTYEKCHCVGSDDFSEEGRPGLGSPANSSHNSRCQWSDQKTTSMLRNLIL